MKLQLLLALFVAVLLLTSTRRLVADDNADQTDLQKANWKILALEDEIKSLKQKISELERGANKSPATPSSPNSATQPAPTTPAVTNTAPANVDLVRVVSTGLTQLQGIYQSDLTTVQRDQAVKDALAKINKSLGNGPAELNFPISDVAVAADSQGFVRAPSTVGGQYRLTLTEPTELSDSGLKYSYLSGLDINLEKQKASEIEKGQVLILQGNAEISSDRIVPADRLFLDALGREANICTFLLP